jgi:ssDNA-binding replication factor A large subunit
MMAAIMLWQYAAVGKYAMFSLTTRPAWFVIAMLGRSFSGREVESLEKLMSLHRRADTMVPVLLRLMIRV